MRKFFILGVFIFWICIIRTADGADLDDIDRSLKDFEREMRLQKQQQSLQQQKLGSDIKKFGIQKQPTVDKAITENEKKFKEYMERQQKNLAKDIDSRFKIPNEYRWIIELFTIAIFIGVFSFIFYRQRHRKIEEEREVINKKDSDG